MLICVLSGSERGGAFSRERLMEEFVSHFGIGLDLESWYIQQHLEKLIDSARFRNERVFVLEQEQRKVMLTMYILIRSELNLK